MFREKGTVFIEFWYVVVDKLVHQTVGVSKGGEAVEHPLSEFELEVDAYGLIIDGQNLDDDGLGEREGGERATLGVEGVKGLQKVVGGCRMRVDVEGGVDGVAAGGYETVGFFLNSYIRSINDVYNFNFIFFHHFDAPDAGGGGLFLEGYLIRYFGEIFPPDEHLAEEEIIKVGFNGFSIDAEISP